MDHEEAVEAYKSALRLYKVDQTSEAFGSLDAISLPFPNNKHFAYLRALCLATMNRYEEALFACSGLVSQFSDKRAPKTARLAQIPAGERDCVGTRYSFDSDSNR